MSDHAPGTPHHRIHTCFKVGVMTLRVHITLAAEWTLLFGPSGSGKSSLLRTACGLLTGKANTFERANPDGSWTMLKDRVLNTPPEERHLSWAPQRANLFPHLTVRENIAFGSKASSTPDDALVGAAINLFQLESFLRRMPGELSGGERQRVNLARAFARPDTKLLLLDEPFAGIDRELRDELLPAMRDHLRARNLPVLSVSHDVEEALQLDAYVIVLREGMVRSEGPAAEALAPERVRMLEALR